MASVAQVETAARAVETSAEVDPAPTEQCYDRSSIVADAMVMIADQSSHDFEQFAPANRFCDYIDGTIYMPSPATERHQLQVGFLHHLLDGFRLKRGTGLVLLGPAVLRISSRRKPEPDLFVLPAAQQSPGKAVLAVEVLSNSTRGHDLGLKLTVYRDAKIPEIWLVDDRERAVIVERLVGDGYKRDYLTEGVLVFGAIPGFWLDVSWLWIDPLPDWLQCLDKVLAGVPTKTD